MFQNILMFTASVFAIGVSIFAIAFALNANKYKYPFISEDHAKEEQERKILRLYKPKRKRKNFL